MEKTNKYLHIVSEKITNTEQHELDNTKDKSIFIKYLIKDLGIKHFQDISDGKNNLFRIIFSNFYYNIFIEFPDGGGRDVTKNDTHKKIAIPFHIRPFQRIIEDNQNVLVINIYVPLNDEHKPDYINRIYLIIKPSEIYSSKVLKNKTWNPSSRWVDLKDILSVLKNENFMSNPNKNVYIVHPKKIQWFFKNILKKEYAEMIKQMMNFELERINLLKLIDENSKKYNKYRKLFRENLISQRGIKCEINNCKIRSIELMIASHIKPVNKIINDESLNKEEKIKEISDPNNGFLLCPNHDALFDQFLISFDINGVLITSESFINEIHNFNLKNNSKTISIIDKDKVEKYLKYHKNYFLLKENKKINN